jgi:hypothetical protein
MHAYTKVFHICYILPMTKLPSHKILNNITTNFCFVDSVTSTKVPKINLFFLYFLLLLFYYLSFPFQLTNNSKEPFYHKLNMIHSNSTTNLTTNVSKLSFSCFRNQNNYKQNSNLITSQTHVHLNYTATKQHFA